MEVRRLHVAAELTRQRPRGTMACSSARGLKLAGVVRQRSLRQMFRPPKIDEEARIGHSSFNWKAASLLS